MGKPILKAALVATAFAFAATPAAAEDLTIALASEATSIDPHFHNLGPNHQVSRHMFDRLINQGPSQELNPGLAVSWAVTDDPTVWEFKLRQGVSFHDGSPFTADDVAFSIERAPNVPNSPSSMGTYVKQITEVIVVDDHTIRLKTASPYPLMPNDISTIAIISREVGEGAATEDYNSGAAAVGTGPYKFVSYTPGQSIELVRNEDYWGEKPHWENVTLQAISSGPARVAALLAGDVDMIEGVPTADIPGLRNNDSVSLSQGVSNRVIYLHIDSDREVTPMVTAKDGSEIGNPFLDLRVRQAVSMAINRPGIVDRVMDGVAIPAGQLLPEGFFGVSGNLEVVEYDPEGAKALLAEAGYGDGFKLTIHGPNDRYINDAQIVQAIAQMLSRVGIESSVDTMPRSTYFGRASALEFSLMLVGWGSGTGEASSPLKSLLTTHDRDRGFGASNRGRYSNPDVDAMVVEALATVDDARRQELLAGATEIAMADVGLIPLHFQVNTWGTRPGIRYDARTDEYTMAMGVEPVE